MLDIALICFVIFCCYHLIRVLFFKRRDTSKPVAIPRQDDGTPWPGEAIRISNALYDEGREQEAIELLHRCRDECAKANLFKSVATLSDEILALSGRKEADALGETVLEELAKHPDGILQTELYKAFPELEKEPLRYACYRLNEAGKITRSKKGRSYQLRLKERDNF